MKKMNRTNQIADDEAKKNFRANHARQSGKKAPEVSNSKAGKPTSRSINESARRIPRSNEVRAVNYNTDVGNTKGFREWERTGKVDLDLAPTDNTPKRGRAGPSGLQKAAALRLRRTVS